MCTFSAHKVLVLEAWVLVLVLEAWVLCTGGLGTWYWRLGYLVLVLEAWVLILVPEA